MDESVSSPQPAAVALSPRELAASLPIVRSAARWFWWIAGLSLVNTVMSQTEANTSFVMGLGITAIADSLLATNKLLGLAIDALALGFFVFMGFQAQRAKLWPFYLGVVVYALDALIYAYAEDWMPVAFHGLAIFFITKGVMVLRSVLKAGTSSGV